MTSYLYLVNPGDAEGGDPDHDGGVFSEHVVRLEYHHVEDDPDEIRVHPFAPGVIMEAAPGGMYITLYRRDGRPIVADF